MYYFSQEINRFPRKTHAYNQNSAGLINHPENKSSSCYVTLIMSINAINFLIKEKDEKIEKMCKWMNNRQAICATKNDHQYNNEAEPKIQTWHIKSQ